MCGSKTKNVYIKTISIFDSVIYTKEQHSSLMTGIRGFVNSLQHPAHTLLKSS